MHRGIVFSDLDGTLVHFKSDFAPYGEVLVEDTKQNRALYRDQKSGSLRICTLLPDSTIGRGVVSVRSAELIQLLRASGVAFVLITGARKSTLLERLPFLPAADAYVAENGGRIYFPDPSTKSSTPGLAAPEKLRLDHSWAGRLAGVCGDIETTEPPETRPGRLWDLCRAFAAAGLAVDTRAYTANFRVDVARGLRGDRDQNRANSELRRVATEFGVDLDRTNSSDITCTSNVCPVKFSSA
eukprot:TRINITY_DN9137_c0_g1_i1.p1 TRINITY_DN9137_c0_g1~~TRINITY_DN9137_c0_g1_i1.p1  ORF type:complete len:241 (+),score=18.19 TRINITY_DN9137_c0_g1_i1:2-724(+)